MSTVHRLNLALRFALEVAALLALANWGWTTHVGLWRAVWALGLPLVAAALWGTFRVPDDPGTAPIAVPGPVRLLLEAVLLGAAAWALLDAGRSTLALAFAAVVLVHYLAAHDRVRWLLAQR